MEIQPTKPKLYYHKLRPEAIPPRKMYDHDVGYDLFACLDSPVLIYNMRTLIIPTGLIIFPEQHPDPRKIYCLEIRPKSGHSSRSVDACFGTVEPNYVGEIGVNLRNVSGDAFVVKHGDKIGQLVFDERWLTDLEESTVVPTTDRGDRGFGSTGNR